jgi:uncharacterized protein YndB with AHSA1/START domain
MTDALNPALDLQIQRDLPLPPSAVWRAWTEPELLMQWFTPKPWRTTSCTIDLRPGGAFSTVMEGPDGEVGGGDGCYLEVVPERRLVWTGSLLPGFRPAAIPPGVPVFTAIIAMEPRGIGTHYSSTALHSTAEGKQAHEDMGFEAGWGAALDQLVDLMTVLEGPAC